MRPLLESLPRAVSQAILSLWVPQRGTGETGALSVFALFRSKEISSDGRRGTLDCASDTASMCIPQRWYSRSILTLLFVYPLAAGGHPVDYAA